MSFEHFLDRWSSVPAEMKAEPRWLMWRLETRPRKGGKPMPTKVPLQTSGAYAKSTDPSTWTTFENACGHIHTFDGIGFGLGFAVVQDPVPARVPTTEGSYYWGGAASTAFWIDPTEELTAMFFTQLMPSSTHPLRPQLRQLVYSSLLA